MKTNVAIFALFMLFTSSALAEVLELNKENFNQTVNENQFTLVVYYDPLEKVSKKFLPKFELMSKDFESVVFAKLNGEKEIDLADDQGIDEYPTFEMFVYGVPIKFYKEKSVSELRKFVTALVEAPVLSVSSLSEVPTDRGYELFYVGQDGSRLVNLMTGVSKKHEDLKVVRVTAALASTLAQQYSVEVNTEGAVFAYRKHDQQAFVYDGELESFPLEKWIVATEYPQVSEFNSDVALWLINEKLPLGVFFTTPETDAAWIEEFKTAAPKVKGMALSVIADSTKQDVQDFAAAYGVKDFPQIVFFEHDEPIRRYICRRKLKKVTSAMVINCAHDFEARDLERLYKSEAATEEPVSNVNVVVGKNFGKKIFSNFDSYNIVFFYNSETTEQLAAFQAFAAQAGQVDNFIFSQYNLDLNEHKHTLHVKPATTMIFSPDDDNLHEVTAENFSTQNLLTFIEDKAPAAVYETISSRVQQ